MSVPTSPSECGPSPVQVFDGHAAIPQSGELVVGEGALWLSWNGSSTRYAREEIASMEVQRRYARLVLADGVVVELQDEQAIRGLRSHGYQRVLPFDRSAIGTRLLISAIVLVLLMAGLFTHGTRIAVAVTLPFFPAELEQRVGKAALQWFRESNDFLVTDIRRGVLQSSLDRIEAHYPDMGPVTVLVSDHDIQNAFALPGGFIVIYQGILDVMETEDELFGLLAHELGHIRHRHGTKRLLRSVWLGFATGVLLGDVTAVSALLIDSSSLLVAQSYNRDEEREADAFAAEVLRALELEPGGLGRLLARITGEGESTWMTYLSSHPPTQQRMTHSIGEAAPPGRLLSAREWAALKSDAACLCTPSVRE